MVLSELRRGGPISEVEADACRGTGAFGVDEEKKAPSYLWDFLVRPSSATLDVTTKLLGKVGKNTNLQKKRKKQTLRNVVFTGSYISFKHVTIA